jgi:L-alanine-DL-glutamate epimerase-like enolase superfamily enzyme
MKITEIQVREVSIPRIYTTYTADPQGLQPDDDLSCSRYQILEFFTDTNHVGLGEVADIAERMLPLRADDLRDLLLRVLKDGDVADRNRLLARVAAELPAGIHPELRGLTLFGVEIALLDLAGKYYGAPLYELLGGRRHDRVDVCWVAYMRRGVSLDEELNALEDEISTKVSQGLRAFKLKVGEDHSRDLDRIARIRQVAGPEVHLRVDASGAWEEGEAIEKIRDMAAAGVDACETPVVAVNRAVANDNPERINENADEAACSLARVRKQTPIRIIEHVADLNDGFSTALVRHRAVDVFNVIPSQAGGILRSQRLIHIAQTAGIPVLLGSTVEMGPGTAAFVHLAVASRNVTVPSDLVGPGLLVDDVCKTPFRYRNGALEPFEGPGLGVELDEEKMNHWAV